MIDAWARTIGVPTHIALTIEIVLARRLDHRNRRMKIKPATLASRLRAPFDSRQIVEPVCSSQAWAGPLHDDELKGLDAFQRPKRTVLAGVRGIGDSQFPVPYLGVWHHWKSH